MVLAFAGSKVNPVSGHSVVWAGIVSEVLTFSEYWNDPRFASKKPDRTQVPDNFYESTDGGFIWQPNSIHGPDAQDHDTGGLNVLVFIAGTSEPSVLFYQSIFGLRMVGRRGKRITNLSNSEWQRFETWLNAQPQVTVELTHAGKSCCYKPPRCLNAPRPASPSRRCS